MVLALRDVLSWVGVDHERSRLEAGKNDEILLGHGVSEKLRQSGRGLRARKVVGEAQREEAP